MIRKLFRTATLSLVIALCSFSLAARAQNTNQPSEKKATTDSSETAKNAKKGGAGPFHGKLAAVDKMAKTITVGKRTFQVTSETKIKKAGKPATLSDGVVGEPVSGYVKPAADGKLMATTVNFGPKASENSSKKSAETKESK
jgi:hypothetical protein